MQVHLRGWSYRHDLFYEELAFQASNFEPDGFNGYKFIGLYHQKTIL